MYKLYKSRIVIMSSCKVVHSWNGFGLFKSSTSLAAQQLHAAPLFNGYIPNHSNLRCHRLAKREIFFEN